MTGEKNNNDNEQTIPDETSIKKETKPAEDFPAPSASNGSLDEQKIEGPSFTKEKILASPKLRSLAAAENLNLIELRFGVCIIYPLHYQFAPVSVYEVSYRTS